MNKSISSIWEGALAGIITAVSLCGIFLFALLVAGKCNAETITVHTEDYILVADCDTTVHAVFIDGGQVSGKIGGYDCTHSVINYPGMIPNDPVNDFALTVSVFNSTEDQWFMCKLWQSYDAGSGASFVVSCLDTFPLPLFKRRSR